MRLAVSSFLILAVVTAGAPMHAAVMSSGFVDANAPYPSCHASTIVETAPGQLVAAWFAGTREGQPDVGIWVSRHEKDGWTRPVEVATGVQPEGPRHPTWNPVLFQAPAGPLLLFYKVGPSPRAWWGMVLRSADGGTTWGKAERLPDSVLGPIKNKPVVLSDGSWLAGSSTEGSSTGWRVHFELSRDQGKTWQAIGPVDNGGTIDAIQPSILFHRDGRLQALVRTRSGFVGTTWSKDQGQTWSALAATSLPNPNSGIDALTLADGRHLVVYNHSAPHVGRPTSGVRYPLDVALSEDGVDWKRVVTLESAPVASGYAYPAVIQAADGRVHITYTWDRKRIKHVVLDPKKL